jgi:hypothetical protein
MGIYGSLKSTLTGYVVFRFGMEQRQSRHSSYEVLSVYSLQHLLVLVLHPILNFELTLGFI